MDLTSKHPLDNSKITGNRGVIGGDVGRDSIDFTVGQSVPWFAKTSERHGVQRARRIFREELFWFDDAQSAYLTKVPFVERSMNGSGRVGDHKR